MAPDWCPGPCHSTRGSRRRTLHRCAPARVGGVRVRGSNWATDRFIRGTGGHPGVDDLPAAVAASAGAAVGQIAIAASAAVDSDDGDLTACDADVKRSMRIGAGHADSSERGSPTESAIRRADGGYSGFRRPPAEAENAMLRRGLGWGDKCWRTAAGASAGLTVTPRCFSGSPAPAEQAEMPNAYAHRAGRRNGAPNQRSGGNYRSGCPGRRYRNRSLHAWPVRCHWSCTFSGGAPQKPLVDVSGVTTSHLRPPGA